MASRKSLSLAQKVNILELIEKGATYKSIAAQFEVGKSTICGILKNSEDILIKHASVTNPEKCCRFKVSRLDEVVLSWLTTMRQQGLSVTDMDLANIAILFNGQLNGDPTFKVRLFNGINFQSQDNLIPCQYFRPAMDGCKSLKPETD